MSNSKFTYRASGVYPCKRRLSAVRLGIIGEPAPFWLETAAREGNFHEKIIKSQLTEEGYEVFDEQRELTMDCGQFGVMGHIDGRTRMSELKSLLEIKSMSQFEFDRWMRGGWDAFQTYANQLTLYWHMVKAEQCLYIVKNRSSGYVRREMLTEPPRTIVDIIGHITLVEDWVRTNNCVMDAEYDPESIDCKRCPYTVVLGCVKTVHLEGDARDMLMVAEAEWLRGDELEERSKELLGEGKLLKDGAKAVFEAEAIRQDKKGQTWRFGGLNILHKHANRKAYTVKASEWDETRITKAKGE